MKRPRLRKSSTAAPAPATSGLTTLDRNRAASLADEGGASAATVESQDEGEQARTEARTGGQGQQNKIRKNVQSVEAKVGKPLER